MRLSVNQITVAGRDTRELVEGCVRHGIPAVGLWREPVAEAGIEEVAKLVADAGIRVSSLCRGGFFTGGDRAALEDNLRALDEAAALGAPCLVLVAGGLPAGSKDLPGARAKVMAALEFLAPEAGARGVRLAVEALHPMFCADRAVVSTLGQALALAEPFPAEQVGVVVDTYHLWWDPRLAEDLPRTAGRIASYQVSDWCLPLAADTLRSRGLPGDGHIDLPAFTRDVSRLGYTGDVEVEVMNAEVAARPLDDVLADLVRRHRELIAPHLQEQR
ncbi:sugar phosphate isomerase/epimerase [Amycolatopsis acidiphila]|uniref:Sugar phosphate isomerase/epimerase n=1 Tax=Amycolatopsis acidiphila TaxID=715473 RepID=A0A558ALX9_9PSEU|nr:sugar phosphate isomerase/epimerase family protein [Amycolatopsis acidiphila]TVT25272.1 sugar phosphate isomerase/epimerase [Amycolatopsis acidiphila]UIJ62389.1 sugar phosphate isomerase/epimerase [Amycolatopsis acidiphila]GHG83410.1 3-dehydroshikimate dehydratase [Amycolatopsis acidiphila]